MKKIYILFIVLIGLSHNSCTDLDPEIYSEILPENYFETEAQVASFVAAAYGAMQNAWALHELADLASDQSTVPVRASGGWNDGGIWPRLMRHEFNSLDYVGDRWNHWSGGISTCNRLIESLSVSLDPDDPAIAELRGLRAYYFYVLADLFGNIPLESRFAEADPLPSQSTPAEAFAFIESELLEAIPNMTESTAAYAKMNKWVAYTVLANLYTNAVRFGAGPHYSEAADAAAAVIESTKYSLEPLYFSNFITENEGSSENIFVVPYDRSNMGGFSVRHQALNAESGPTFGFTSPTPWGGFSIQEDFYNAFDASDKRRGMFIAGLQYTIEAGTTYSEEFGFFYSNPKDEFALIQGDGTQLDLTIEYTLLPNGAAGNDDGARYQKYQLTLGETNDISNDFAIFRFAEVLLMRAEGLWRQNNGDAEALMLVNQVRERAGLGGLVTLTEDDLYWEYKKETALENHARSITIRFGHWEDAWFLKEANADEEYKRWYAIPESQLGANPNLVQNPGYIGG